MGLPVGYRLRRRRDFKRVYAHGARYHSQHLILRALAPGSSLTARQREHSQTRIGISIGKKVSRKAVVRNRIKRQIRAIFRILLPQVAPGWQVVAIVKPEAVGCAYAVFLQELEQLLGKAGIS